jgi:hypothetical protein
VIFVVTGFLHFGISSITEFWNSQKNARVNDLGIGVAVICNICGDPNCLKKDLCSTQNLCCSSIIAKPRL